jgi:hypothetical protein
VSVAPPGAPPAPGTIACPRCAARVAPDQEWCLNCGAPARTRLVPTPNWRAPLVLLAVVAALAGIALAIAFVALTNDNEAPPPANSQAPPPSATAAPQATPAPAQPGTTQTPGATPTTAPESGAGTGTGTETDTGTATGQGTGTATGQGTGTEGDGG